MTARDDIVQVHLPRVLQEAEDLRLAVRGDGIALVVIGRHVHSVDVERSSVVVQAREQTLAVQAVTPEGGAAHAAAGRQFERTERHLAGEPAVPFPDVGVIVVAVLVADMDLLGLAVLQPVAQVILGHVGESGIVALGERVHVVEVVAAQQVVHALIVLSTVDLRIGAAGQGEEPGRTPLEVHGEVQVPLVHAALLEGVFGPVPAVFVIRLIHVVQAVPVYMGVVGQVLLPGLAGPGRLHRIQAVVVGILHVEVTGQVAVVVRTGILRVIPVEGRVTVLAETVEHGGCGVEGMGRGEVVLEDGNGFVRLADPGVAHLAVLVTPVGVVHVVAHEVVHFLGGGVLRTALTRRAHDDGTELVHVVELLLNGRIIGERTVIHPLDPVVSAQAGRYAERVGQAVIPGAGSVGQHQTQPIQLAVGKHAPPPALADGQSVDRNVGEAVVPADTVVGNLRPVDRVLGAGGLVEAAPQRERRISGDGVVHLHAGQVHVLALGGIPPYPEPDRTEIVACNVVEDVILAKQDGRIVVVAAVFQVKLDEVVDVHLADDRSSGHREVEHVLDVAVVDRDVDARLQEILRPDDQVVDAVVQALEEEPAGIVGRQSGDEFRTLVQLERRARDRRPVGTAHDRSSDSACKLLGGEAQGAQEGDKR